MKQAIIWLEDHALANDGLLHQGAYADWADSIARSGRVLYPNILYWKALHDLAQTAQIWGKSEDKTYFSRKANQLKQAINSHFWREDLGYFVTSHQFDILSSSGNLMTIA